jgi:BlaI family transcriptional regulator, penicillinase repressor
MTLNNSEWTIMEKLWEQPYTMMQLYHILEEETGWSKSTVVTMLGRMVDKGLAAYHEGGRAREYYPLVRKEDVALSETKSLIDRVFKGSVNMMMSALWHILYQYCCSL